jgi:uncharacterized membrane protein
METIKLFVSMLITALILDITWLGFFAKKLYGDAIGGLLRKSGDALAPNYPAAFLVYVAIIAGILLFVLPKAQGSYVMALAWGALFGFLTYAVYDFTNLAILTDWPLPISIIDILWGTFLYSIVTLVGVYLQNNFFKVNLS